MQDGVEWLLPLSDPRCGDRELVGAKAQQLHALAGADFPVPDAWVLNLGAFRAHLGDATPDRAPLHPVLSETLLAELANATAALIGPETPYLAVRSSALGEDSLHHSFAGQHATYYYVNAEGLAKAVLDCWLSLWSEPALAYREQVGVSDGFGMAVIIQTMVQAERSGVCFTRDPTGRAPENLLIEATWGLGAALVDGRVSPDRFELSPDLELRSRHIGHKRLKVAERLRDPTGARLEAVPAFQQKAAVLSASDCEAIGSMAQRAETLFGAPQDVEWCYEGTELKILQSRPITALPQPHSEPGVEGRWVLFKPVAENVTEPLTPITVDLYRRVLPPFGQFIAGRYYLNADLLDQLLPFELSDGALKRLLLLRGDAPQGELKGPKLIRSAGLLSLAYLMSGISWHRSGSVPLERLADFDARCRTVTDDPAATPLDVLRDLFLPTSPWLPMSQLAFQVNVSAGRYFILLGVLKGLLTRWAPEFEQSKLSLLTGGGEQMISAQMVDSVRELAAQAAADEALKARLLEETAPEPGALLAALPETHTFRLAFEAFLERFGHRAIRELELMTPRWAEEPSAVLQMVRNYLKPGAAAERRLDPHGLRLAALDELHQALGKPWRRRVVDKLLERVRYYVTVRENTRHYHTKAFTAVRLRLKDWEQQLLEDGRLRCADDVFFLSWPELAALEAGAIDWADVEASIRERRRAYLSRLDSKAVEAFNFSDATDERLPAPPEGAGCTGDCASPGVAEGLARVILDPAANVDLEPGEILVAPYTDPAWTPLFPGAAAVIVEVGSYLSHAGTVAREYQIPCLVDATGCTQRLKTGQRLRVNADEGWVQVLEELDHA